MKKLLAVSVLLAGAGVAMGQQYVLVDLGTFQGESSAFAVDANSMPETQRPSSCRKWNMGSKPRITGTRLPARKDASVPVPVGPSV